MKNFLGSGIWKESERLLAEGKAFPKLLATLQILEEINHPRTGFDWSRAINIPGTIINREFNALLLEEVAKHEDIERLQFNLVLAALREESKRKEEFTAIAYYAERAAEDRHAREALRAAMMQHQKTALPESIIQLTTELQNLLSKNENMATQIAQLITRQNELANTWNTVHQQSGQQFVNQLGQFLQNTQQQLMTISGQPLSWSPAVENALKAVLGTPPPLQRMAQLSDAIITELNLVDEKEKQQVQEAVVKQSNLLKGINATLALDKDAREQPVSELNVKKAFLHNDEMAIHAELDKVAENAVQLLSDIGGFSQKDMKSAMTKMLLDIKKQTAKEVVFWGMNPVGSEKKAAEIAQKTFHHLGQQMSELRLDKGKIDQILQILSPQYLKGLALDIGWKKTVLNREEEKLTSLLGENSRIEESKKELNKGLEENSLDIKKVQKKLNEQLLQLKRRPIPGPGL
ncbi:hypothetical protein [Aquicella lusitana]|uniref:Uncharacterized protein n=1 Tax=Aquicella lusitana TaxID=254246 RepID=A0A370G8G2_9COXI|nr:hypothetical protein [Aquicella lusitana]RDI40071.1 hypothetical protein C8D86_12421 [Aquicella lusitana]VVC72351.1 hypothetical protein AQULUS_00610 [Aquicella lusitana]